MIHTHSKQVLLLSLSAAVNRWISMTNDLDLTVKDLCGQWNWCHSIVSDELPVVNYHNCGSLMRRSCDRTENMTFSPISVGGYLHCVRHCSERTPFGISGVKTICSVILCIFNVIRCAMRSQFQDVTDDRQTDINVALDRQLYTRGGPKTSHL